MAAHPEMIEKVRVLLAEAFGEPVELLELQRLVPHDDDLMRVKRVEKLALRLVIHRLREIDPRDFHAEDSWQVLDRQHVHPAVAEL